MKIYYYFSWFVEEMVVLWCECYVRRHVTQLCKKEHFCLLTKKVETIPSNLYVYCSDPTQQRRHTWEVGNKGIYTTHNFSCCFAKCIGFFFATKKEKDMRNTRTWVRDEWVNWTISEIWDIEKLWQSKLVGPSQGNPQAKRLMGSAQVPYIIPEMYAQIKMFLSYISCKLGILWKMLAEAISFHSKNPNSYIHL